VRNWIGSRDLMEQKTIIADPRKHGFEVVSVAEPDLMANDPRRILVRQTMYSLSNAFTSAFKECEPIPQFPATTRLGRFLDVSSVTGWSSGRWSARLVEGQNRQIVSSKYQLDLCPYATEAAVGEIPVQETPGGSAVHGHLRNLDKLRVVEGI
jgi:hypothetical protein